MKTVAIIPSRYGSTRFDGKPLAEITVQFKGETFCRPMIYWTCRQANNSESVDEVYVATDDERIKTTVDAFEDLNCKAIMTSDACRSGTDRVGEAAEIIGLAKDDLIVNIQGDQPAFCPLSLNDLVMPFKSDAAPQMSTLAYQTDNQKEYFSPKDCKVTIGENGYALYFSRSPIPCDRDRKMPDFFYKHLGFYAYTFRFLNIFRKLSTGKLEDIEKLEQLRAIENGHRIKVELTPYDSPEVDLSEDIPRIEKYMYEHREILGLI